MNEKIFDVTNNVIIISGGSRGLGREIARQFTAAGSHVVIGGHAAAEVEATVKDLHRIYPGSRAVGLEGDISNPEISERLVNLAVESFGRLDHVVSNAGIDVIKPAVDYSVNEWWKVLKVNLGGCFNISQAAARYWIEHGQKNASITMTSSIAGSVGIPTLAPYAASKGGINQLVKTLATEWAEYEIRVNAIAPGYIDNIMDGVVVHGNEKSESRIRTFTPLGRRGSVAEIAAPYLFLASPAASYITGAIIAVDGGYTAL
ncbi:SDR family oxidoreductase [Serratia marcescens]|nr:SDR family oxidoreductase [Serratia marcescens]